MTRNSIFFPLLFHLIITLHPSYSSSSVSASPSLSGAFQQKITVEAPLAAHRILPTKVSHDSQAFTQGFLYDISSQSFIESTGQYQQSSVRRVNISTGQVKQKTLMHSSVFGEGCALVATNTPGVIDKLWVLTWKAGLMYEYDVETLELSLAVDAGGQGELGVVYRYGGEGWGLTSHENGSLLYMSDGSNQIRTLRVVYHDRSSATKPITEPLVEEIAPRITVRDAVGNTFRNLNELELIHGELWANIWYSDIILRIDPHTGNIISYLNLQGLLKDEDIPSGTRPNVLNGIAYEPNTKRLWLTGKNWPVIYEIQAEGLHWPYGESPPDNVEDTNNDSNDDTPQPEKGKEEQDDSPEEDPQEFSAENSGLTQREKWIIIITVSVAGAVALIAASIAMWTRYRRHNFKEKLTPPKSSASQETELDDLSSIEIQISGT